jgi:small subunit ribosomal protein S17
MSERGKRNRRIGKVISNKMDKTVVVTVERKKRHHLYGKTFKRTSKFKAHDEKNECKVGDIVQIMEVRPISKEKRWLVTKTIEHGKVMEK